MHWPTPSAPDCAATSCAWSASSTRSMRRPRCCAGPANAAWHAWVSASWSCTCCPGGVPLAETVDTLCELQQRGRIRHWGVSNFDQADMQELHAAPGGPRCAANQVYYSLGTRGVEFDLLPWHARQRVMTMAYSPIDQGALATHPALSRLAEEAGLPAARLALAWRVREGGVVASPMSANRQRQADNLAAASLSLGAELLARLDGLFPPPTKKMPLATT